MVNVRIVTLTGMTGYQCLPIIIITITIITMIVIKIIIIVMIMIIVLCRFASDWRDELRSSFMLLR